MRKAEFGLIVLLILTVCSALCACGSTQALAVPQNIRIEGRALTWDAVENAEEYLVYVECENVEYKTKQTYYDLSELPAPNTYAIEVMAVGDGIRFTNSDWIAVSYQAEEIVEFGYDESGFAYRLLADGTGYEVGGGKHDMNGVLTIPDYFKGLPVKKIADKGFLYASTYLPNAEYDYACNKETTEIHLPKHLETIGSRSLGCLFLIEEITIPDTVTEIGDHAFYGCIRLKHVTLPKNLKVISEGCFENCALEEIIFPETLEEIGKGAFACRYISAGIQTPVIGHSFTKITIPDTVKSIGIGAFLGCKRLLDITVPKDLERLEFNAFLDTAWYDAQPDGLVMFGNILYKYKGEMAKGTKITIPSNVKYIVEDAFDKQENLVEVIIPDSVTTIGGSVFSYCTSLKSVTWPANLKSIGAGVFSNCSSLKSITLPANLQSIGGRAFFGCSALESITLPENLQSIGSYAFSGCSALESITLPENLQLIGEGVFSNCSSLKSITLPANLQSIVWNAFSGCSALESITLPANLQSIGSYAFYQCDSLKEIVIPNSVTKIGYNAFDGCAALIGVTFENPNGWKIGATEIASWKLSDPALALQYLMSDNIGHTWTRSE